MRYIAAVFFALQVGVSFSQAPGNVSTGLRWWLKANANVYSNAGTTLAANGSTVQQWNDLATANHASQVTAGNRPTYRTNRINGYPTLDFTGNHFLTAGAVSGVGANESFYMFLVFKQNSYILGAPTDGSGSFLIDRTPENNELMSFKMVTGNKYNYQSRNNGGGNLGGPVSATVAPTGIFTIADYYRIFGTEFGIYLDGRQDVTLTTGASDAINGVRVQIGRHAVGVNQGMNGEMAEIVLYNTALSTADRRKVDSYLALKYGITLDPNDIQDYYSSDGTRVFPALNNASYTPYRWDVAGIIQDDASGLLQTTSRSQNTNYVVTVSSPSAMDVGRSLVWGSNNGSLTSPNTVDVDGTIIKRRLSRVWRFRRVGNLGTVTISFDLSAVPGSKSATSLRLLIDTDDDGFADNNTVISGGSLVGSVITFTGVTITNNDNVTIGTTDVSTSPLPVELTDFDVVYEKPDVKVSWNTASELNNRHFVVQRSVDGIDFRDLAVVAGHGTTLEPHAYSFIDHAPLEGRTYYRLNQVDFDGEQNYSPLRAVVVDTDAKGFMISPNPVSGSDVTLVNRSREVQISFIELIDEHGRVLKRQQSEFVKEDGAYHFAIPESTISGVYVLRIFYNGKTEAHRLAVMR